MQSAIKTVAVVGTGVIGSSWTGLFLARGLRVLVSDPMPEAKTKLKEYLDSIWPTLEVLGCGPGASKDNWQFVGAEFTEADLKTVDFVQENAPERPSLKQSLLASLDAKTRPDVTIASSSSGIPSSQFIQLCTQNPSRVLIGHPFNPPHLMPLVEVVPHPGSAQDTIQNAMAFYSSLGKRPILLRKEVPGFAANRMQAALCQEAYSLVQTGVCSAEDVDFCITAGLGPRWAATGPFMSNVLGGGGGKDGFRHIMNHLAPAIQGWIKDMRAHEFEFTSENMDLLDRSVQEDLAAHDPAAAEKERDEIILKILAAQKQAEKSH